MIAFCGLTCDTCPIYLATLEMDLDKKNDARIEILKTCRDLWMNLKLEDISDCDGCRENRRLFSGCSGCQIRTCALERSMESCAYCSDFACSKLQVFIDAEPSAREGLEKMIKMRPKDRDAGEMI